VKRVFLSAQWIDALSLDDDDERILKGIESLKQGSTNKVKEKLHPLLSQYRKEKEKIKEVIRGELTEKLKSEKIDGSAVDLKIEGSEIWKKEKEKLSHSYKMKLEEIKQQLRGYR
jgi:phenylalanyl-tRNA synthetase alpha subunit